MSEKEKNFIGKTIDSMDSKVSVKTGKTLYKIFRIIGLILTFVVFPIIFLVIGVGTYNGATITTDSTTMIVVGDFVMSELTVWITLGVFSAIYLINLFFWFWFSKFNVKGDRN